MRYVLKQKFWSWGDDFTIQNADGQDAFFVQDSQRVFFVEHRTVVRRRH